ncbi:MAG: glycosyltransferase [Dehalococcoidia bacterium]|nr:glycosyltransferase [Dehalococcoidia bacterium]
MTSMTGFAGRNNSWTAGPSGTPLNRHSSVAALVPHFHCEEWLADCLSSLLDQSHPLDAIVVIDDGSGNPPVEIVRQFPQVTLLASDENVGPYRLVQQVINDTDFDAYLFQDADDWSTRDRLEILLAEAEETGAELIGSQEVRIISNQALGQTFNYVLDVNFELRKRPWHYGLLHPTSLVSRDLVRRLGGYATGLRFSGDLEFLQRAVHVARVRNVPCYCYFRRKRDGSLTTDPSTALRSPERLKLWEVLKVRSQHNAQAVAQGLPVALLPYIVSGPIDLDHVLGPEVRQRRASVANPVLPPPPLEAPTGSPGV